MSNLLPDIVDIAIFDIIVFAAALISFRKIIKRPEHYRTIKMVFIEK